MIKDLVKRPHKTEPSVIFNCRRVVILLFIILLLSFTVLLVLRLRDGRPTISNVLLTTESLPMPDVYFTWDQPFSLACNKRIGVDCDPSLYEIEQPTFRSNPPEPDTPYVGSISRKKNMFPGDFGIYLANFVDETNFSASAFYMTAFIFDKEYNPWRQGFQSGGDIIFDMSLNYTNLFVLADYSYNTVQYSRVIRRTIKNHVLSYIGFRSEYNIQPYVESIMQAVQNHTIRAYQRIEVSPRSYIVSEQTEHRNDTILSVLGTVCAYYGFMLTVYTFLFGVGAINPWGIVQKKFRRRRDVENTEHETTDANLMEPEEMVHRIRELEDFRIYIQDNIIDRSILESAKKRVEKREATS